MASKRAAKAARRSAGRSSSASRRRTPSTKSASSYSAEPSAVAPRMQCVRAGGAAALAGRVAIACATAEASSFCRLVVERAQPRRVVTHLADSAAQQRVGLVGDDLRRLAAGASGTGDEVAAEPGIEGGEVDDAAGAVEHVAPQLVRVRGAVAAGVAGSGS